MSDGGDWPRRARLIEAKQGWAREGRLLTGRQDKTARGRCHTWSHPTH